MSVRTYLIDRHVRRMPQERLPCCLVISVVVVVIEGQLSAFLNVRLRIYVYDGDPLVGIPAVLKANVTVGLAGVVLGHRYVSDVLTLMSRKYKLLL